MTSSFTRREGGIVGGGEGEQRIRATKLGGEEETKGSRTRYQTDFDFPDDEQTKLLRSENYHQVGEALRNITKRGGGLIFDEYLG